ncbi:RidA family protein [Nonomuraea endophytica]|uniref:RidA family protein n=1 Tax=Nonomuraea endophytica TaxID=714136 RepID=UPI0037CA27DF
MLDSLPDTPPTPAEPVTIELVRRDGDTLFASGQVAMAGDTLVATGPVTDLDTARHCAWQCARNLMAAVLAHTGSLDDVHAVKLTVYVASAPGFTEQHLVAHAASQLVRQVLGPERGRHARAAIGVAALPLGSQIEVEGVFRVG